MKSAQALTGSLLLLLILFTPVSAASPGRIVTGDVIANRSVTLSTRIMGRITQVNASEGEQVKSGQVIVEIDDAEYRARLKVAQALTERARAELAHRQRTRSRLEKLTQTDAVSRDAVDEAIYALEVPRPISKRRKPKSRRSNQRCWKPESRYLLMQS